MGCSKGASVDGGAERAGGCKWDPAGRYSHRVPGASAVPGGVAEREEGIQPVGVRREGPSMRMVRQ